MCGRYVLKKKDLEALLETLGIRDVRDFASRYNIGPATLVPAVRPRRGEAAAREAVPLQWGLVPSWSRDAKSGAKLANARSEGIADRPAFRSALRQRRCVVPASGFYEWQTIGKLKHPWYFSFRDDRPFLFAGLWEWWRSADGVELETCALITTTPNSVVAPLHDRMPVILREAAVDRWLDPAVTAPEELVPLLQPTPGELMQAMPVSPRVNSVRHEGPELLTRTEPPAPAVPTPPAPDAQLPLF
jgi:putative SOS response-associated peptidase YedK